MIARIANRKSSTAYQVPPSQWTVRAYCLALSHALSTNKRTVIAKLLDTPVDFGFGDLPASSKWVEHYIRKGRMNVVRQIKHVSNLPELRTPGSVLHIGLREEPSLASPEGSVDRPPGCLRQGAFVRILHVVTENPTTHWAEVRRVCPPHTQGFILLQHLHPDAKMPKRKAPVPMDGWLEQKKGLKWERRYAVLHYGVLEMYDKIPDFLETHDNIPACFRSTGDEGSGPRYACAPPKHIYNLGETRLGKMVDLDTFVCERVSTETKFLRTLKDIKLRCSTPHNAEVQAPAASPPVTAQSWLEALASHLAWLHEAQIPPRMFDPFKLICDSDPITPDKHYHCLDWTLKTSLFKQVYSQQDVPRDLLEVLVALKSLVSGYAKVRGCDVDHIWPAYKLVEDQVKMDVNDTTQDVCQRMWTTNIKFELKRGGMIEDKLELCSILNRTIKCDGAVAPGVTDHQRRMLLEPAAVLCRGINTLIVTAQPTRRYHSKSESHLTHTPTPSSSRTVSMQRLAGQFLNDTQDCHFPVNGMTYRGGGYVRTVYVHE